MTNAEIALGTKLFSRETKLHQLLQSVPANIISTVYVADDGDADHRPVFEQSYPFDLVVIDMEYDAGLGAGREAIVDACEEDYLLVLDSDHEVPENVDLLAEILDEQPEYGGVSGILDEYGNNDTLLHDLYEEGNVLIRDIRTEKEQQTIAGGSVVEFDFLPNIAMFRMECLDDYSWDPFYVIEREHIDFYVGHWKETDWKFACCFDVKFPHHPGGSSSYLQNRESYQKKLDSTDYFLEKWEYSTIVSYDNWFGMKNGDRPLHPLPTPPAPLEWQAKLRMWRREAARKYINLTAGTEGI